MRARTTTTQTIGDYAPSSPGQGVIIGEVGDIGSTVDADTGTMHYRLGVDLL